MAPGTPAPGAGACADVDAAFAATPREDFLPPGQRPRAGLDGPLEIGHGQTSSQPSTVRDMLRLLGVRAGDRVLDVGCGSGWSTALLAHLTGPSGSVVGVERVAELVEFGEGNLARAGRPWARVVPATPDRLGAAEEGPYDRILVSAQARELPTELVDQLRPGGVMVIPVSGRMLRVLATPDGPQVERTGHYRFVPLLP